MATPNSKKPTTAGSKSGGMSKALIWTVVAVAAAIGLFLLLRPAPSQNDVSVTTGSGATSAAGVTNVDEKGLTDAQSQGARVIDVRTTGEYAAGHIPGAENVPLDQLSAAIGGWDKSAPVLLYCATGARSSEAVNLLQQAGFQKIYHFNQGIQAWTGSVDTAASSSPPPAAKPAPTTRPVMYDFYTDT